jgi:hypothetical protein
MKCKLILRFMQYKFEFRNVRVWPVSIAVLEAMRPRPQLRGRGQGQWFEAEAMPFSGLEAEAEINISAFFCGLPRNLHCWESTMVADRYIGFRKNAVIWERIDRFSRKLTRGSNTIHLFSEFTSKIAFSGIQDGGRPPYSISNKCCTSRTD